MKTFKISNYKTASHFNENDTRIVSFDGGEDMQVSDGFHTLDEVYDHRITLWIKLCEAIAAMTQIAKEFGEKERIDPEKYGAAVPVWRSKKHSDGELAFGGTWFVLGIDKEKGKQITYHLPIDRWGETEFAETLETAPEWDGHTPTDVLERIKKYI